MSTRPQGGQFLTASYAGAAGSRPYKLFVPSGRPGGKLPLIVMLHACAQSPDDFAAGTRMNAAAEAAGCLVAYPEQTSSANMQRCWNWFSAADQQRGQGEPALIAGLVAQIAGQFPVDRARIYAAGLSAGGAAAAVLGIAYPDLFAAIGVHSGLACGAARDMGSAFTAMMQPSRGRAAGGRTLPVIVFHGDRDTTVHPGNGAEVVAQATTGAGLRPVIHHAHPHGQHPHVRTEYRDAAGVAQAEHWLVHGGGHAWFGGAAGSSNTDPRGPDATAEMLRFFLAHPKLD